MTALAASLRQRIETAGPLRLNAWMAACNAHYYATRDPLGSDFITAPEISQMFGELVGGWIADLWQRGNTPPTHLVELGPGRGTLMADALRTAARAPGFTANTHLHLVETSPALRTEQARRLTATWHDSLDTVPGDRPLIIIANEFLDALPIRQGLGQGLERAVTTTPTGFAPTTVPGDHPPGESSPATAAIAARIGDRLHRQGGAALIIDYGYTTPPTTDTLQALNRGHPADPFADPGENDLTAHVDFTAFARAAGPITIHGPVPQGVWLTRLGIEPRAAALKSRATPPQAAAIEAALVRLTAPTQMGALFKVLALTAPDWPTPAGFTA